MEIENASHPSVRSLIQHRVSAAVGATDRCQIARRTRQARAELEAARLLDEPRDWRCLGCEFKRAISVRGENHGQERIVLERLGALVERLAKLLQRLSETVPIGVTSVESRARRGEGDGNSV